MREFCAWNRRICNAGCVTRPGSGPVQRNRTIDVMIATFCIEGGHELLHSARDFDVMEKHLGLKVVQP